MHLIQRFPTLNLVVIMTFLAIVSRAYSMEMEKRDDCGSGSVGILQIGIGQTYNVCCPGSAEGVGLDQYCCVHDKMHKKRDICIGFCATSSCVTSVPITASDYSDRVSSATATMTTTNGGASATTTGTSNGGVKGIIPQPTHLLAGGAIAAAVNAALLI